MFTKSDIRRVSIVIPAEEYGTLFVKLGKSSLIHLDRDDTAEGTRIRPGVKVKGLSVNTGHAEGIVSSASRFYAERELLMAGAYDYDSVLDNAEALYSRDSAADLREAVRIGSARLKYEEAMASLEREISAVEEIISELRRVDCCGIDFNAMEEMEHISFLYGTVSGDGWLHGMKNHWFYRLHGGKLLVLFPAAEKSEVAAHLGAHGFTVEAVKGGSDTAAREGAEKRLGLLKKRASLLKSLYESMEDKRGERIAYLAAIYTVLLKITGAESAVKSGEEIVIISGWLNLKDAPALKDLLQSCCGGSFYVCIADSRENRRYRGRIPVLLKNIKLFKPFELLVRIMGTPGNIEIDPTPAAAIAYTLIFGVMFGDLGQGLTLAAAGVIILAYTGRPVNSGGNLRDIGGIMIWCGLSAALFGILYGSVFSNEHILPALLFHPMENMTGLFIMAVTMGAVFISTGLCFNIVNSIIAGEPAEAFFSTKGLAGLAVYLSVIFFVMRYLFAGLFPSAGELFMFLIPPAVFFAARGPLGYILFHEEEIFPNGIFEYSVESMVEVIEMFSGFLGNTISYIRAGAFALSHAGLSIAVFTLAEIVDPSGMGGAAILVIAAGNVFIILLEGIVCSIQSMRLECYEFFSKFFKGDGVAFTPFSLKFMQMKNGGTL